MPRSQTLFELIRNFCAALGAEWSYDEADKYGPSKWSEVSPQCGGSSQSPVNIRTSRVVRGKKAPTVKISGSTKTPSSINYKNDGHGFALVFNYADEIRSSITGGPLGSRKFIFHNLHIHWPSEHTVNGRFYDAEMHLVHYNSKYATFADALKEKDGLAVLGVFLETPIFKRLGSFNRQVRPYIKATENVREPDAEYSETENLFTLFDILKTKTFDIWSYNGSLTTPSE
jgi:carbonic anhydrase